MVNIFLVVFDDFFVFAQCKQAELTQHRTQKKKLKAKPSKTSATILNLTQRF